jgi:WD40 repeat protein
VAAEGRPALSPDGRQLASGVCVQAASAAGAGCLQHQVRIWDTETGAELRTLQAHTGTVSAVAYSPDGRWLASAGTDTMIHLWDAATGALARSLAGHTLPVASLAFAPDSRTLASGSFDNVVRLWDTASGAPLGALAGSSAAVPSLAYSPDGALLAAGSAAPDSQIRLWRMPGGSLQAALPGHLGQVQTLAFHPSGRWLASGGAPAPTGPDDFTLRLWRLADDGTGAQLVNTLRPHNGAIFALAFSPDGRLLATGSFDATIQLWAVQ